LLVRRKGKKIAERSAEWAGGGDGKSEAGDFTGKKVLGEGPRAQAPATAGDGPAHQLKHKTRKEHEKGTKRDTNQELARLG